MQSAVQLLALFASLAVEKNNNLLHKFETFPPKNHSNRITPVAV
jgi:hypothetical protein